MNLKVNIKPQDVYDFNDYFFENSDTIKKALFKNQLIMGASPLAGGIIVVFILISLPFYFLYPGYHKRKYRKEIKKLYSEGKNKGIYGEHEYTIEEDGLLEKTAVNETKQNWNSIEKIVQDKENTYVFINSIQAHVFPKASVIEGNYESFVNEIKKKI
ncbi:YcxB family protein [Desulfogranum japonicum]|uniref:YcxB family protein n=1 Tax=Desulfogranum japonicum TaxID=231447 RepID=UPI0003F9DBBE|nr:YcxB family protein [Desulfogranum japonicum]